jgi:5-hydroxyisourate hydrolase
MWWLVIRSYIARRFRLYDLNDTHFAGHGMGNTMGKISTHVLDTTLGKPGAGIKVELYRVDATARVLMKVDKTNGDGRCATPLAEGDALVAGNYELVFGAGAYFAAQGAVLPDPPFLDRVIIAFGVADATQNYHVPLVVTPWSYSTYRGS